MKGLFFRNSLEFRLTVDGELWSQGDTLSGTLDVTNKGSANLSLQGLKVILAVGVLKKVRAKNPDAFDILETQTDSKNATLNAGQTHSFNWSFKLDINCPVTDVSKSPFLLYGVADSPLELGQLQATVQPEKRIFEFLKALEIQNRFVRKSIKTTLAGTVVKFDPPDSKAFAHLESTSVTFTFDGDLLNVSYLFQVKKLEAAPGSIEMKKEKQTVEQTFTAIQLFHPTGRVLFEPVEKAVKEALDTVERKSL